MLGFVIAIAAGLLTPQAEVALARPVAKTIARHVRIEPAEMRLLAFMLVMLLAGIAAELLDSGSPFWVVLGGTLGYFGQRIIAMFSSSDR